VAFVAVTVRVDELPAVIELGFATMLTVGAGGAAAATVTDVAEEAFPPAPVAVAV
jgi:shikimate 5-dehydrogenase